jgi:putative ABC transport system substrate-binding protein
VGADIAALFEVRREADYEGALQLAEQRLPDALLTFTDELAWLNSRRVADFALAHRLATMCEFREMVAEGCLVSYGPIRAEFAQIIARQLERVLRGAKAADLRVEQVTPHELVLNMKTARALGLTIPPSVLVRADAVLE